MSAKSNEEKLRLVRDDGRLVLVIDENDGAILNTALGLYLSHRSGSEIYSNCQDAHPGWGGRYKMSRATRERVYELQGALHTKKRKQS